MSVLAISKLLSMMMGGMIAFGILAVVFVGFGVLLFVMIKKGYIDSGKP